MKVRSLMTDGELQAYQRGLRVGYALGLDRDNTFDRNEIFKISTVVFLTGLALGFGFTALMLG